MALGHWKRSYYEGRRVVSSEIGVGEGHGEASRFLQLHVVVMTPPLFSALVFLGILGS